MARRVLVQCEAYDKQGRLLTVQTNDYERSSRMMRFFAKMVNDPYRLVDHAEIRAIDYVRKRGKKVAKLIVTRYNKQGELVNAKPCEVCQAAIAFYKIGDVEYSTDAGTFERL